jgi:hypothetical protein
VKFSPNTPVSRTLLRVQRILLFLLIAARILAYLQLGGASMLTLLSGTLLALVFMAGPVIALAMQELPAHEAGPRIMAGWGLSVLIMGLMFKFLNFSGGNVMLWPGVALTAAGFALAWRKTKAFPGKDWSVHIAFVLIGLAALLFLPG